MHLDTDVLDAGELPSVNVPGTGGLSFGDARAILQQVVKHKNLVGLDISQYNPDKDADGSGAKKLVELLVEALSARLELSDAAAPAASATKAPAATEEPIVPAAHAEHEVAVDEPVEQEPVAQENVSETVAPSESAVDEHATREASTTSETDVDAPEISSPQSSS